MQLNLNVVHMPARDLVRILDAAPKLEVLTLMFDPRCSIISDIAIGFMQFVSTQLTFRVLLLV